VLKLLVDRGLLSPGWAGRILSWRHTGFNAHSRVRARTKSEAERVGYRHGPDGAELERMDYLEFIARVVSHIPDKGQVMVRYYGLYANADRGKVRKASRVPAALQGPSCRSYLASMKPLTASLWTMKSIIFSRT